MSTRPEPANGSATTTTTATNAARPWTRLPVAAPRERARRSDAGHEHGREELRHRRRGRGRRDRRTGRSRDDERERAEHERDRERVEVRAQRRADEERLGDEQPGDELVPRAAGEPRRAATAPTSEPSEHERAEPRTRRRRSASIGGAPRAAGTRTPKSQVRQRPVAHEVGVRRVDEEVVDADVGERPRRRERATHSAACARYGASRRIGYRARLALAAQQRDQDQREEPGDVEEEPVRQRRAAGRGAPRRRSAARPDQVRAARHDRDARAPARPPPTCDERAAASPARPTGPRSRTATPRSAWKPSVASQKLAQRAPVQEDRDADDRRRRRRTPSDEPRSRRPPRAWRRAAPARAARTSSAPPARERAPRPAGSPRRAPRPGRAPPAARRWRSCSRRTA